MPKASRQLAKPALEREEWMNFRTSYLVGLMAAFFALNQGTLIEPAHAEGLKITGPDGQVRQQVRQYGPTTPSDTFWSIAQKVRPDSSVSIYQSWPLYLRPTRTPSPPIITTAWNGA